MIVKDPFSDASIHSFPLVIERLMSFFEVDEFQKVAHILGMSGQSFYARRKTESIPYDQILNAVKETDINLEWLFYGEGEKTIKAKLDLSDNVGTIQVKFYPDISASAGMGCLNGDFCEYELISIDKSLVPNVMSKNIEAIRIMGDSMDPTIKNKDVIFVDKSQRTPINGKIFVVKFAEETFAKRIFKSPKGYIIKSDNPQYPQYEVQSEDFEILGQIIYNMEYLG
jgi:phage repressor protein C with HTH and peptisase S24 domain